MKFKRKSTVQKSENNPLSLALLSEDDTPLINFHPEMIDALRRMISRLVLRDALPARLALTSALRQEGVTYLSRALATIMANDLNVRVCVIELNWWWPNRLFLSESETGGLAAVLAGEIPLRKALVHTGQRNLVILPAGKMAQADRPVLARNEALKNIIQELSEQFDHLILDIPAILTTNDAIPLVALGDSCCLVIHQGVTSIENVRMALDDIDHLKITGIIMNKARIATPPWILKLIPQDSISETGTVPYPMS